MMPKLNEVKKHRRKRKYVVVRRIRKKNRKSKGPWLKKPYTTKLGRQLKANQIGDSPRVKPLEG